MITTTSDRFLNDDRLLSELVRNTNNAVIITNLQGEILFTNNAFTDITGYSFEEVAGQKPGNVLQGERTDPSTVKKISEALSNFDRVNERILNYHKTGSEYWLQLDIYPIFDEQKRPSHFMAIESVITDLKVEEQLVIEQEKRISENIQYAQKLQDALFRYHYKDQNRDDLFVLDQPKDRVGGDFLLIEEIQGKKIYFCGDCTGHGASGAILTALAVSIIKELLSKYKTLSPGLIVTKAQEKLIEMLRHQGKATVYDSLEGTLVFVNPKKKEITYYTSSQDLFLVGPETQKRIRPIRRRKTDEIEDTKLAYSENSWIYLSTDGWKDQFGGDRDKKYGSIRIFDLLSSIHNQNSKSQLASIRKNLADWKRPQIPQTDDILVLGIRL